MIICFTLVIIIIIIIIIIIMIVNIIIISIVKSWHYTAGREWMHPLSP